MEMKQATTSMVTILHHHGQPGASEQFGNGLLRSRPFRHAVLCGSQHRMRQVENEQSPWNNHVSLLLCFRRRFPWIRVRNTQLPGLR